MGAGRKLARVSVDEFLAWEEGTTAKHELVTGEIFAMGGARVGHVQVVGNLYFSLRQRLRPPCAVYMTDLKVRIDAAQSAYYPDLLVSCVPYPPSTTVISDPSLVIEVLSESTADFDRKTKRDHYRLLPSVQAVLLADLQARRVELDRREGTGWVREEWDGTGTITLPFLHVALTLDDIFGPDFVSTLPE